MSEPSEPRVRPLRPDEILRLDLDELRRRLNPGTRALVRWTSPRGSATVELRGEGVWLGYTANGAAREQVVRFVRSDQHLGGTRAWLACPSCGRRVRIIYLAVVREQAAGFECATCVGGIVYTSQLRSRRGDYRAGRALRRLDRALRDLERPHLPPDRRAAAARTVTAAQEALAPLEQAIAQWATLVRRYAATASGATDRR